MSYLEICAITSWSFLLTEVGKYAQRLNDQGLDAVQRSERCAHYWNTSSSLKFCILEKTCWREDHWKSVDKWRKIRLQHLCPNVNHVGRESRTVQLLRNTYFTIVVTATRKSSSFQGTSSLGVDRSFRHVIESSMRTSVLQAESMKRLVTSYRFQLLPSVSLHSQNLLKCP